MKNLKIGTRLSLGFGGMVVLIATMALFAYVQLHKMQAKVSEIARIEMPKVIAATGSLESIQKVAKSVVLIIAVEDPAFRAVEQKHIGENRTHYGEAFKKLGELEKSDKGKALIERIKQATAQLSPISNKIITLALAGNQAEADTILRSEWTPALTSLENSFGELIAYQNEQIEKAGTEAAAVFQAAMTGLLVTTLIAILLASAAALLITRSITAPLGKMRDMVKDIAQGEGDLTKRLDGDSKDELGEVSRWFNVFVDKLHGIMNKISDTTHQVASASCQLNASAQMMATGSEEVSAQAGTVATAGEEMSATSGDIAQNCQYAAEGSQQASAAAVSGAKVVDETIIVMNKIAGLVRSSAKAVENLGLRSEQIGTIVGTIEDIADQTNLLALNAAIEAARAGDQGRGFAVVADEVRALAERTTRATREIGEMIKTIQLETKSAVVAMEEGVNEVAKGSDTAANSGRALEQILEQINAVTSQIAQVATAAEEQTATTSEISSNMQQITDAVAQTASGAQQSAVAAEQLSGMADNLRLIVRQFKL